MKDNGGLWTGVARRARVIVYNTKHVPAEKAMGYSLFFNRQSVIDLRALGDTSALVLLAWTARAWPFTTRAMVAAERRISPEWHEAAWLSGMSRVRRIRWIAGPVLTHPALATALIAYLLSVLKLHKHQVDSPLAAPPQSSTPDHAGGDQPSLLPTPPPDLPEP